MTLRPAKKSKSAPEPGKCVDDKVFREHKPPIIGKPATPRRDRVYHDWRRIADADPVKDFQGSRMDLCQRLTAERVQAAGNRRVAWDGLCILQLAGFSSPSRTAARCDMS